MKAQLLRQHTQLRMSMNTLNAYKYACIHAYTVHTYIHKLMNIQRSQHSLTTFTKAKSIQSHTVT